MKNERRASLLIEAVKDEDMEVIAKLLRRKSFSKFFYYLHYI